MWTTEQHGLREDFFPTLIERLQEFSPEDLTRAQERYFDANKWAVGASGVPDLVKGALGDLVDDVDVWDLNEGLA